MTTFFPDVSDFQKGLNLAGVAAVIAKADEGTSWTGLTFAGFRAQASSLHIPFLAYDFIAVGNVDAQVDHVIATIGEGQNLMTDVEAEAGQPNPQLVDVLAFADRYAARSNGGRVVLAYIPRWYWAGDMGSPDLTPLTARGIGLISSDYTTYSDTGPGWAPYGGVSPVIWQYTSSAPVNGQLVDRNAFRGTIGELAYLFAHGTQRGITTMRYVFSGFPDMPASGDGTRVHYTDGVRYRLQQHSQTLDELATSAGAGPIITVTPANSGLPTYALAVWHLCGYADPGEFAGDAAALAALTAAVAASGGAHTHNLGASGSVSVSGSTGPAIPTPPAPSSPPTTV